MPYLNRNLQTAIKRQQIFIRPPIIYYLQTIRKERSQLAIDACLSFLYFLLKDYAKTKFIKNETSLLNLFSLLIKIRPDKLNLAISEETLKSHLLQMPSQPLEFNSHRLSETSSSLSRFPFASLQSLASSSGVRVMFKPSQVYPTNQPVEMHLG